ncbi:hypothetical protein BK648_24665 [Pseudomonas poae]|uniref:Probable 2-phosphosulfolactate phosphatase n=1 Tax=Pseudomonas poae TaxID=200451 RepID=A0A423ERL6_9PSED|nr:2-phosphosulfolactate phosphatase [Pseudomonas poae]ROM33955.1 hypothetical protein BK648_24665 [Pseudomonas poae]
MRKLNVILRKEELDPAFLHDKVVVVIDVLFATSTIVTALSKGASSVHPVAGRQLACEAVRDMQPEHYLLAGESYLQNIPGFAGYAPLDVASRDIEGRRVVYSTTNGTVALRKADSALHVYAAALLNAPAMVRQLQRHDDLSIVFVCAGSGGRVNLEDLFAAGYLIEHLEAARGNFWHHTDTSSIARAVYRQYASNPHGCLLNSHLGRTLQGEHMREEIRHVAQIGLYDTIPKLDGQCLVALTA